MGAACRRFNRLIIDLHARIGLRMPDGFPPAAGEPARVELEWRGVRFRIGHDPALDATSVAVQCVYGMPQHGQAQEILVRLLEVNLVLALKRAGVSFGMDADSGEVVYVFIGSLSTVTGASLFEAMKLAAVHALHWRDTFLLGDPFRAASAGAVDPNVTHV